MAKAQKSSSNLTKQCLVSEQYISFCLESQCALWGVCLAPRFQRISSGETQVLLSRKFCSWLRLILCLSLLKAMAENQWNCKVTLNLNNVRTMPSTWMSFILRSKKLLSCTLLDLKSSRDSLISSPSPLPSSHLAECLFHWKCVPDPIFICSRVEEASVPAGVQIWAPFFPASAEAALSFHFNGEIFLRSWNVRQFLFCYVCMFCWCCFPVAFVLLWTFKDRLFSSDIMASLSSIMACEWVK